MIVDRVGWCLHDLRHPALEIRFGLGMSERLVIEESLEHRKANAENRLESAVDDEVGLELELLILSICALESLHSFLML